MSADDRTPEQQLGELAARALDGLNGRRIVGAALLLVYENDEDTNASVWFAPEGQPWQMTFGIVEDWRLTQQAQITASAVQHLGSDEEDEE